METEKIEKNMFFVFEKLLKMFVFMVPSDINVAIYGILSPGHIYGKLKNIFWVIL